MEPDDAGGQAVVLRAGRGRSLPLSCPAPAGSQGPCDAHGLLSRHSCLFGIDAAVGCLVWLHPRTQYRRSIRSCSTDSALVGQARHHSRPVGERGFGGRPVRAGGDRGHAAESHRGDGVGHALAHHNRDWLECRPTADGAPHRRRTCSAISSGGGGNGCRQHVAAPEPGRVERDQRAVGASGCRAHRPTRPRQSRAATRGRRTQAERTTLSPACRALTRFDRHS